MWAPDMRVHRPDKVPPFLIKLFKIVSSPASDNLIQWCDLGTCFRIIDKTRFAQALTPTLVREAWKKHDRALHRKCCRITLSMTIFGHSSDSSIFTAFSAVLTLEGQRNPSPAAANHPHPPLPLWLQSRSNDEIQPPAVHEVRHCHVTFPSNALPHRLTSYMTAAVTTCTISKRLNGRRL